MNSPRRRRSHRSYRRNRPVYRRRTRRYSSNPATALVGTFKDLISLDSLKTVITGLLGWGASLAGPQALLSTTTVWTYPAVRVLASLVATGVSAVAAGYLTKDREVVRNIVVGGLIGTGWRALSEVVPAASKATFPLPLLAGMGDPQTEAFKRAIEGEIQAQLKRNGMSAYLTPRQAIAAQPQGMGMHGYLTPGQVADAQGIPLSGLNDEFDTRLVAEKF